MKLCFRIWTGCFSYVAILTQCAWKLQVEAGFLCFILVSSFVCISSLLYTWTNNPSCLIYRPFDLRCLHVLYGQLRAFHCCTLFELSTSLKFQSFFVAIIVNCLGEPGVASTNQAYLSNKEMQICRENFHVDESKWAKSKKCWSFKMEIHHG